MEELTSNESNSTYSSDEDHVDLFFPLLHYLMTGRKRHRIENYLLIDSWRNQEFKEL